MTMEMDYPAAHSMDTLWFAVDRDGHVAAFHSLEAGAVPLDAMSGDSSYEVQERLRELLPATGMLYDPAGRLMPGQENGRLDRAWSSDAVLLFLTSLEPVRAMLSAGRGAEVKATEGLAVVLRNLTTEELTGFKALPEFRGCVSLYDFDGEDRPLAEHGFYEYDHLTENWISGPYGRESVPARPIHIDQLPPDLRDRLDALRYDKLRFAETLHIQPVELGECASWESAYVDVTGKRIGPMPGKEDEYEEAYSDLQKFGSNAGFEVEPPAEVEEEKDEE